MEQSLNRYSRQTIFPEIGPEGQKKLGQSFAVIIGCGALGSVIADLIVRAGAGKVRIIDRDFIEYHNLQRQALFDEEDIKNGLPKAVAAERHVRKINSSVEVQGVVADVNYTNIERLTEGANIILDGLDNFEGRFLINDVSLKHGVPWVYGGAIASSGMTMAVIPGQTACLRCIHPEVPLGGRLLTCETAGIFSPVPHIIGSLQAAAAVKMLIGAKEIKAGLTYIDVWRAKFKQFDLYRNPECPACKGDYQFLSGDFSTRTVSLCGQNSIQVMNPQVKGVSFKKLAAQITKIGMASYNEFMLSLNIDNHEIVIFPDGRAIIKNTNDEAYARGLYSKIIGV